VCAFAEIAAESLSKIRVNHVIRVQAQKTPKILIRFFRRWVSSFQNALDVWKGPGQAEKETKEMVAHSIKYSQV
jgi:hypothetical protein